MSQAHGLRKPLSAFPKIRASRWRAIRSTVLTLNSPPIDQPTETQHKLGSYIAANRESTPPTAVANRRVPRVHRRTQPDGHGRDSPSPADGERDNRSPGHEGSGPDRRTAQRHHGACCSEPRARLNSQVIPERSALDESSSVTFCATWPQQPRGNRPARVRRRRGV